jgi:hypothetical protein
LLDKGGKVVAAINVSMEFQFKDSPNLENTINKLIEKGKMISNSMGYNGPYPSFIGREG